MTMRPINRINTFLILLTIIAAGCAKSKDYPDIPEQNAYFSYSAESYLVSFTNESKTTGTYQWDFGDGTKSTEENPVHNFGKKGKYLVTLNVTSGGDTYEAATVMLLDKTSKIKLDDGTVSDWDNITKNVFVSGPDGMGVKLGKYDYDANYIYMYIEQASTIADGTIFSLFIDSDTLSTGFDLGTFPGIGAENYFEGEVVIPEPWFDPYKYSGDGSNWAWDYLQVNDFYKVGHVEESDGLLKYELAISRTKIPGLTNEAVRLATIVMDSGWSDFGYMPDKNTSGYLLMMNE